MIDEETGNEYNELCTECSVNMVSDDEHAPYCEDCYRELFPEGSLKPLDFN